LEEFHRTVPFGCRRCWHVWEEHYIVRRLDDQHGNAGEVWLKGEVCVPPPLAGAICPGAAARRPPRSPRAIWPTIRRRSRRPSRPPLTRRRSSARCHAGPHTDTDGEHFLTQGVGIPS
jgi:hypothetical protein